MNLRNKKLGARGEQMAHDFLKQKGFEFVAQNYHSQGGEIDLIMWDEENQEYILIEVKTRLSDTFGGAKAAITPQKIKKMMQAAEKFFFTDQEMQEMPDVRVDIIFIENLEGRGFDIEYHRNFGEIDF